MIILLAKYLVDHSKEDEMGRACDTYGGKKRCTQCFGW